MTKRNAHAAAPTPVRADRPGRAGGEAPVPSASDIVGMVLERKFGVEYQPVVDLASGRTVGHEALARFRDPRGRSMSTPDVFARLHEEPSSLLHVELETKLLAFERAPAGPLYVNVDPDSFRAGAGNGKNALLEALAAAACPIVVEAIETTSRSDACSGGELVRAVRARGLGVALDDVGAPNGLVSLDLLCEVDVLKLDRSWLVRAAEPRSRAVLDALAALARRLGTRTVLEGVETADHLALARDLCVDAVQGFLFRDRFVASRTT